MPCSLRSRSWIAMFVMVDAVACFTEPPASDGETTGDPSTTQPSASTTGSEADDTTHGADSSDVDDDSASGTSVGSNSTTAGSDDGPPPARWCDTRARNAEACADFDGPLDDWSAPARNRFVTTSEDETVALSRPASMAFVVDKQELTPEPLNGLFTWSAPPPSASGSMTLRMDVWFSDACDWTNEPRVRVLELGVGTSVGDFRVAVRIGPGHVEAWNYMPGGNNPIALAPVDPALGKEVWVPVELAIHLLTANGAPEGALNIAGIEYALAVAWGGDLEIAELRANFGPWASGSETVSPCSYNVDNVALFVTQ